MGNKVLGEVTRIGIEAFVGFVVEVVERRVKATNFWIEFFGSESSIFSYFRCDKRSVIPSMRLACAARHLMEWRSLFALWEDARPRYPYHRHCDGEIPVKRIGGRECTWFNIDGWLGRAFSIIVVAMPQDRAVVVLWIVDGRKGNWYMDLFVCVLFALYFWKWSEWCQTWSYCGSWTSLRPNNVLTWWQIRLERLKSQRNVHIESRRTTFRTCSDYKIKHLNQGLDNSAVSYW